MPGRSAQDCPARAPDHTAGYVRLMTSIAALVRDEPLLRQRSLRQALVFAGFSAYWTSIAYELSGHHGFNQAEIGLFALVGAVDVAAAPVAGGSLTVAPTGTRPAA
jgi:hypothetical protein